MLVTTTTLPLVALLGFGFGGAPTPVRPLANPEAFYLVHYGGEYVDTLEGLIDKKLGAHSEL